jgi:Ni/Co efflux regulator RcnB
MKRFLIPAAAAALVFATPALAKEHHHDGDKNDGKQAAQPAPAPSHPTHMGGGMGIHKPPTGGPTGADFAAQGKRDRKGPVTTTASPGAAYNNAVRNNNRNDRHDNDRHDNNNWRGNDRHGNDRHDNNNNWRGNNDRHDNDRHDNNWNNNRGGGHHGSWQGRFNRRNVTAQHHYRYRGDRWRWPRGYSYQRWAFGMTLPSIFWANNYWINDYYSYGLGAPPPGTVWVRYGDDAVLIDRYTGEILEVVYDQFY